MVKLKIGDKLVCHTELNMESNKNIICLSINSIYIITNIKEYEDEPHLILVDDRKHDHWFPITDYNMWFDTIKDLRLKKLKIIEKI